ncbi:DUF1414 domain-containing protein [Alginatibacterium sediminis]|uniref:UPF0352 protein DBZ36_03535 n=1 Tax=Alginatibacterium sediminis TaxID=2164068 RepID=A0A420EIE9_9ALTE|nr:DUF1414 domain-containing protein [Alginatibacterium sediminis]RKF20448.1 DUF1414 domain-containing protein [Alginatibacterium sediminis]
MAIVSKYSNQDVETLLAEILQVFENNQTPTDLRLMVLGNACTHLLNTKVSPAQRTSIATGFAKALHASIDTEEH